ncbi:hypothetical protein NWE73_11805 [Bdellovibrio sp. PAP01]|uniref:Uncharacterized protein n=1 Tax=Bdellovibrio svalbardensis TaxID=2972972 RepID=A0ABT6DLW1_9BACT|nr:hypothetical protein [Bdellovibrio svalbardensis]
MSKKKLSSSVIASLVLLFSANAFATLTYSQSSGASAIDITDTKKPIIYGGFAGTCTADTTSSTCNSCNGNLVSGTGLIPCNENNISPDTILQLVVNIDNATITNPSNTTGPTVKMGGSTGTSVGTTSWRAGATSFTVTVSWKDLCNNIPSNPTTDCSKDLNHDLYIAFENVGSGTTTTDSMLVKIVTRYAKATAADTSWNYVDCPTDPDPNTINVGFCHFTVFPGDKKIYADALAVSTSFPATPNSGSTYQSAVFFYEIQNSSDADDAATVARITNASPSVRLPVSTLGGDPLADNRIDGLTNGSRYCMVMASKDQTGLIAFYTPTATNAVAPATAVDASTLCTTPEPVVGLLDDKHCFIATAAFGSDMAPEVQSFRDFRNKYLLPFSWGQKFVKTYYKYSPKYAELIAGNETAKIVVRTALWPLLLFARMSVAFGFWISLLIMMAAFVTVFELYRRLILGRNVRGEL